MKYKIIQGESLNVMKSMESNSVDTIITDPPYGLSFMGKKWDYDVPSTEIWKECLRVLKPGGTALIFAGSRTQHRMAVNVEDAGFILKDTIMWLYGSGFPKATDISKQLDKGVKRKVVGKQKLQGTARRMKGGNYGDFSGEDTADVVDITEPATPEAKLWNGWKSHGLKPAYEPILVAVKPNDGTYANNALRWKVAGLNIDGSRIKSYTDNDLTNNEQYDSQKTKQNTKTHNPNSMSDLPQGVSDLELPIKESEKTSNLQSGVQSKINSSGEELQLEGWKDNNAKRICSDKQNRETGTSGSDRGNRKKRSYTSQKPKQGRQQTRKLGSDKSGSTRNKVSSEKKSEGSVPENLGRFPANIILDEEAGKMLDEQSGELKSGALKSDCYKEDRDNESIFAGAGKFEHKGYKPDKGGASRFFYCAKASKSERNAGCEELEEKEKAGSYQFREDGSLDGKPTAPKSNHHPTVKPLKLMEYLCTLTKTPTGGLVLDPFCGSGTTGIACVNTGRDFIGIEREPEYVKIAEARIKHAEENRNKQKQLI